MESWAKIPNCSTLFFFSKVVYFSKFTARGTWCFCHGTCSFARPLQPKIDAAQGPVETSPRRTVAHQNPGGGVETTAAPGRGWRGRGAKKWTAWRPSCPSIGGKRVPTTIFLSDLAVSTYVYVYIYIYTWTYISICVLYYCSTLLHFTIRFVFTNGLLCLQTSNFYTFLYLGVYLLYCLPSGAFGASPTW